MDHVGEAMSAYSVNPSRKCVSCFFDVDDPRHYRLHVIPKNWPAWMSVSGGAPAPGSSVLPDAAGAGTARPPETETVIVTANVAKVRAPELHICFDCGLGAKSAAGLAAHQRKHDAVNA